MTSDDVFSRTRPSQNQKNKKEGLGPRLGEKLQREVGLKTEAENREGLDSRQREAGLRLDQERES